MHSFGQLTRDATPGILCIVLVALFKLGYIDIEGNPKEIHLANSWDERITLSQAAKK